MTFLQAIIIAVLQGVSELFPVSSLGHRRHSPPSPRWHSARPWQIPGRNAAHLAGRRHRRLRADWRTVPRHLALYRDVGGSPLPAVRQEVSDGHNTSSVDGRLFDWSNAQTGPFAPPDEEILLDGNGAVDHAGYFIDASLMASVRDWLAHGLAS